MGATGSALAVGGSLLLLTIASLAPSRWQLWLLFVAASLPLSVGSLGGRSVMALWIVAAAVLPRILSEMLKSQLPVIPKGTGVIWLAAVVLAGMSAINYMRTYGVAIGVNRAYFDIALDIVILFELAWLGRAPRLREKDWIYLIRILFIVALSIGTLRVISFYTGVTLPFLSGTFDYGGSAAISGIRVDRIGGLAEVSSLILATSAGLWMAGERKLIPLSGGVLGLLFVLLSGGRSVAIGVIVAAAVLLYALSLRQKVRLAATVWILAGVALSLSYLAGFSSQLARITRLGGGLAAQDPYRLEVARTLWRQFLEHPLAGKGLGIQVPGIGDEFINQQVMYGGHGAYAGMLGNFGIPGAFVIAIVSVGVVAYAVVGLRRLGGIASGQTWLSGMLAFILVVMSIRSVEYLTGSNGFSDPLAYACAGGVISLWSNVRKHKRSGSLPDARLKGSRGVLNGVADGREEIAERLR